MAAMALVLILKTLIDVCALKAFSFLLMKDLVQVYINQYYSIVYGCSVDINECNGAGANNCSHFCHNTNGSYTCSCPGGFILSSDEKDCSGKTNN